MTKIITTIVSVMLVSLTGFAQEAASERTQSDVVTTMIDGCYPLTAEERTIELCFSSHLDDTGKRIDSFGYKIDEGSVRIKSDTIYAGADPEQFRRALRNLVMLRSVNPDQAAFLFSVGIREINRNRQDPNKFPYSNVESRFARMIINTTKTNVLIDTYESIK